METMTNVQYLSGVEDSLVLLPLKAAWCTVQYCVFFSFKSIDLRQHSSKQCISIDFARVCNNCPKDAEARSHQLHY